MTRTHDQNLCFFIWQPPCFSFILYPQLSTISTSFCTVDRFFHLPITFSLHGLFSHRPGWFSALFTYTLRHANPLFYKSNTVSQTTQLSALWPLWPMFAVRHLWNNEVIMSPNFITVQLIVFRHIEYGLVIFNYYSTDLPDGKIC